MFKKWTWLSFILLFGFLGSCATKKISSPSSKIPERRSFPVSETVSPCEDFFKYTCDGAINSFKLREDRSRHIFSFNDSAERVLAKKKEFLKKLAKGTADNSRKKQLQSYFLSCTDTQSRSIEENSYARQAILEVMALETKKDFAKFLTKKSLEGESSHVSSGNIANLANSDIYDFIIMPSRMTSMPERSYYQNQELLADFKKLLVEFFTIFKLSEPSQRANWVVQFEKEYIEIYPTPTERRKIWTMKKYAKPSQLTNMAGQFELGQLLEKIPKNIQIRNPMDETFKKVNFLLSKASLDQLKSVYLYQALSGLMDEGFQDFFNKKFAFANKYLGGPPKRPDLNERCTRDVMGKFTKEIDAELFDKFFPNFPEQKFISLLEKVRASIIDGLEKNKWLSPHGKKNAIKKMKAAQFQVVRPKTPAEWDFNPIADYNSKKYLENSRILAKNFSDREFERLPKKIDKSIWHMGPLTVNAYYSPTSNKFVMPAGILQYPFYDPSLPEWVNLGAVGAVVGHELGHGVDDQGSKYDEKGKVNQWMTQSDVVSFRKRGESLINQFNGAGHNGELTLGENIGDLVGVTFALAAANKVMPTGKEDRDQATRDFFTQWGRAWCGVMRPKMKERLLKTDPHALVWARVNEQMKHQPEFARVFQCKPTDKLVLPAKDIVTIW